MKNNLAFLLAAASAVFATAAHAHLIGDAEHDGASAWPLIFAAATDTSPNVRTFNNKVTITLRGEQRVIEANGIPDHAPGQFPRRGNPNTISEQKYNFILPTKPQVAAQTSPARGWFGVALNGVPFEAGTAEVWGDGWRYEAIGGSMNLGLDEHLAHVQPTGAYHYHALPAGLIAKLGGDGKKMLQIGWAGDGFPIYTSYALSDAKDAGSALKKMRSSYRLKSGARPGNPDGPGGKYDGAFTADYEFVKGSGDLDECNGRTGITPEFPQGTYYYCLTAEFPFASRLWRGTPDASFQKGGPGPGGPGGPRRRGGPGGQGRPPGPPTETKQNEVHGLQNRGRSLPSTLEKVATVAIPAGYHDPKTEAELRQVTLNGGEGALLLKELE